MISSEPIGSIASPLWMIEGMTKAQTPRAMREAVLKAAEHIPLKQLGTTDDSRISTLCDDTTTNRETSFAKIRARVSGTKLASKLLGGQ